MNNLLFAATFSLITTDICFLVMNIFLLVLTIIAIKQVKPLQIISTIISISTIVVYFVLDNKYLDIGLAVLTFVSLAYIIYETIMTFKIYEIRKTKVQDFLKNSEFEYFIQVGSKNQIIDYSNNILTLTNREKKYISQVKFPEVLFDCLNILTVNGEKYSINTLSTFKIQFNEACSKVKNYVFNFELEDEDNETLLYEGIIQPIYFGNKMIAKNVYISLNRNVVLEKTRNALLEASTDIRDLRNQLYVLMSLTNGVVMYYDFQNKAYVPTEAFMKFTKTEQNEYDFEEFINMMHPEDVKYYYDQTATINSMSTTRLKFRMQFAGRYYNMVEDSINLEKDNKLISVVRILQETKYKEDVVLSSKETNEMLDGLTDQKIDQILDNTLGILDHLDEK